MKQSKDYRKKYMEYYNIDLGEGFEIHHLDGNRNNNSIDNLLLLPKKLHREYHFYKNIVCSCDIPTQICGNGAHSQNYYLVAVERFIEIMRQCAMWYDYKMSLDLEIKGSTKNVNNKS